MSQRNREIIIGAVSVAIGAMVLILARKMPASPAMFPRAVSIAIIILGVLQGAAGLTLPKDIKEGTKSDNLLMLAKVVGMIVLHIALLNYAGFIVANLVLIAGLILIAGYRKPVNVALITAGVTALLYFLFGVALRIPLPTGVLF